MCCFWGIFGGLGQNNVPERFAIFGGKFDEVLSNVVFVSNPLKMTQKQHIGNFQI